MSATWNKSYIVVTWSLQYIGPLRTNALKWPGCNYNMHAYTHMYGCTGVCMYVRTSTCTLLMLLVAGKVRRIWDWQLIFAYWIVYGFLKFFEAITISIPLNEPLIINKISTLGKTCNSVLVGTSVGETHYNREKSVCRKSYLGRSALVQAWELRSIASHLFVKVHKRCFEVEAANYNLCSDLWVILLLRSWRQCSELP